ncbi:MaoC/PaaZ C-terminal domain-containing protein [Streptomyces sp. NPDC087844]|uniref:MaoC/PaaZ C-terminal domain-containing protein n=1 Tax=Streptomyces sp. NPDC087844 TaxID=3365805 RepID=UPI0037F874DC
MNSSRTRTHTLGRSPSLWPLLARGAVLSPFKRPRTGVTAPRTRLVLPGVRVDLGRLAAYERACGFGVGADELPPTYPHVLGFPAAMRLMSGRTFPLPLLGLVHTSIGITQHRALTTTGEYELGVCVADLLPHRRGTEAVVVTEVRAGGELVWESRSTYLARHGTTTAESTTTTESTTTESTGERTAGVAEQAVAGRLRGQAAAAELKPLPVLAEWHLAGDVGRRYGAASGDRNPIHLHPLTARMFGFPRTVAHGMWTVARCLAERGTPQAARIRAEFRAPVLLPGTVSYGASSSRFELRGTDGGRLHLTGEVLPLA